jgi:hypothetical protein
MNFSKLLILLLVVFPIDFVYSQTQTLENIARKLLQHMNDQEKNNVGKTNRYIINVSEGNLVEVLDNKVPVVRIKSIGKDYVFLPQIGNHAVVEKFMAQQKNVNRYAILVKPESSKNIHISYCMGVVGNDCEKSAKIAGAQAIRLDQAYFQGKKVSVSQDLRALILGSSSESKQLGSSDCIEPNCNVRINSVNRNIIPEKSTSIKPVENASSSAGSEQ